MPVSSRFDEVAERLLRAGIAPRHVRRYVKELNDHVYDLAAMEERMGSDEQDALAHAQHMIGDTDMLTEAMVASGRFRSFTARAPWAVFGVFPPLAMVSFFVAMGILLAFAGWFGIPGFYFDTSGRLFTPPDWYVGLGLGITWFSNFLLPLLASSLIAFIAYRQRMPLGWPMASIFLIALMGAGLTSDIDFPVSVAGRDWTIALIVISDMQEILLRILIALIPLAALLYFSRNWDAKESVIGFASSEISAVRPLHK